MAEGQRAGMTGSSWKEPGIGRGCMQLRTLRDARTEADPPSADQGLISMKRWEMETEGQGMGELREGPHPDPSTKPEGKNIFCIFMCVCV